jgi:hypothetical protein
MQGLTLNPISGIFDEVRICGPGDTIVADRHNGEAR